MLKYRRKEKGLSPIFMHRFYVGMIGPASTYLLPLLQIIKYKALRLHDFCEYRTSVNHIGHAQKIKFIKKLRNGIKPEFGPNTPFRICILSRVEWNKNYAL